MSVRRGRACVRFDEKCAREGNAEGREKRSLVKGKQTRKSPREQGATRAGRFASLLSLSIDHQRSISLGSKPRDSRADSAPLCPLFLHPDALTGDNATSRVVDVGRGLLRRRGGRGQRGRLLLIGSNSGERSRGGFRDRPRRRGPAASSSEHAAAALSRGRGRRRRARARGERGDGAPGSGAARQGRERE